jgi:flagellar biosynthesis protein FlhF
VLEVPLDVAFTPLDLRRLLHQHADKDRVFVDTTGRSPADRDALTALSGALHGRGIGTLLCMAAGTRARDAEVVLQAYDPIGIDAVCLTKWDETVVPGEALSVAVERGLPLTHLTVGQQVPADIVPADAAAIARAAFDSEPAHA